MHTCSYCQTSYHYKEHLLAHETVCKFMQLPSQERNRIIDVADNTIPTHNELFHIVQQLSLTVDRQSAEITKLNNQIRVQNRKMNLVQWLQKQVTPTSTFSAWINILLERVPSYIEIALKENVDKAMTQLFDSIDNTDSLPLCVFDHKSSQFYVYRSTTWEPLSVHEFDNVLQKIADRFYTVFVNGWYKENKAQLMQSESLFERYMVYQKNVLTTIHPTKLRQFIYSKIKRVVGTVTEIEFV